MRLTRTSEMNSNQTPRTRGSAGIRGRDWLWLLAINVIANLVANLTLNEHTAPLPLITIVAQAWPGFVTSTTISSLCLVVISRLAPFAFHKCGPWVRWIILIPTLILLAVVGTALAAGLVTIIGPMRGWDGFVATFQNAVKFAIAVTLGFGIYTTITEALRQQLSDAALALRTKERDEAEARRIASESQLASLEARVNPHFFFNTLNSIASLTRADPAGAERMTTQLASLMRSSLDHSSTPLVPLDEELERLRNYLDIEQVRFGDRLRYNVQVDTAAGRALVPRLALQTLVENSVKYAVSPRRDGASIAVRATRANGRLHVEITDDGPGFDAAHIPEGHGLSLIRARLELTFGADAALHIGSRPGATTVTLDMPATDAGA
jgi:two-component sensor histidine kinase